MYEELVRRLRCQRFGNCPNCPMWYTEEVEPNLWRERCASIDAADAIEELSYENESLAKSANEAAELLHKRGTPPKWIPATEALPEEHVFVLIRQDDDRMMVAERVDGDWWYRYFAYDVDRWDENEQGTITHWMPLPEPPKEET